MSSSPTALEEFLAYAAEERRILGVVLTGSRGRGALVHEQSDWDVRVLVGDEEREFASSLDTPHGSPIEVTAMSVSDFASGPDWDRYSYARTRVLLDKLGGEVQRLVDRRGRLAEDEVSERVRAALDAYLNSLHRSLKSARLGLDLESRLDACESVGWLLETVFALEARVRPFNKYLRWELETHPLADWSAESLLTTIEAVLGGDAGAQQRLFGQVEERVRRKGFGDVVDAWAPDVRAFRGE